MAKMIKRRQTSMLPRFSTMFGLQYPMELNWLSFSDSVKLNNLELIQSVGMISKLETSMIKLQKVTAFEGNLTLSKGMCTISCITLIIPHRNCREVALNCYHEYLTSGCLERDYPSSVWLPQPSQFLGSQTAWQRLHPEQAAWVLHVLRASQPLSAPQSPRPR